MNTALALAFGSAMLFLVSRSLVTIYNAHDRRVTLAHVAAILMAAFVGVGLVLLFSRR